MISYDVKTPWDDPTERRSDRRYDRRFTVPLRLAVAASAPEQSGRLVGPGKVRDLSLTGAALVTKHCLQPEQRVDVQFPTEMCPDSMGLPTSFVGSARVVRSTDRGRGKQDVAVAFGEELINNIEFAMYIDLLRTVAPAMGGR